MVFLKVWISFLWLIIKTLKEYILISYLELGFCRLIKVMNTIIMKQNQDADTIRKLAGEANNINQLAHRANAGGFALVAVELVKLKNRIIEIINHLSDAWKNKKGKRF